MSNIFEFKRQKVSAFACIQTLREKLRRFDGIFSKQYHTYHTIPYYLRYSMQAWSCNQTGIAAHLISIECHRLCDCATMSVSVYFTTFIAFLICFLPFRSKMQWYVEIILKPILNGFTNKYELMLTRYGI